MAQTNLNNHFELILKSIQATDESKIAYIDTHQKKYSYKDLKLTILKYQTALKSAQLKENDNVICLTPRGIELVACLLACFSANKTVVFIDPRLGLQNFYKITRNLKDVVVLHSGMRILVFILKLFFKNLSFQKFQFIKEIDQDFQIKPANNPNLIDGFTSGTTGIIKRIHRTHDHMTLSADIFSQHIFPIENDQHMIGYTLSALRNFVDQGTAVEFPHRKTDLRQFIEQYDIQRISGPPVVSYLSALAYKKENKVNSRIQNVVMGGAPAQRWLFELIQHSFPKALIQNVYGCTECEPISASTGTEILNYRGLGYYVGCPVKELTCEYDPVDANLFELIVHGKHVTKPDGHRTGDLVRKLENGHLVLAGRRTFLLRNDQNKPYGQYEIETLIENNFSEIKKVAVKQKGSVLFIYIELFKDISTPKDLENFIQTELKQFNFGQYKVVPMKQLPYDKRHQWKVQYHQL